MPIDYTHQHISSDIMQVNAPRTPISPAGGGVEVDNGVDAPAAVTTLNARGAAISGDQATLVGPLIVLFPRVGQAIPGDEEYHDFTLTDYIGGKIPIDDAGRYIVRLWIVATEDAGSASYREILLSSEGGSVSDFTLNPVGEQSFNPEIAWILEAGNEVRVRIAHDAGSDVTFTLKFGAVERYA